MGDANGDSMHVVMLPWLAFGHILPLIHIPPDLSNLIRVVDVSLPRVERLPEDAEATIDLPSDDLRPYLRQAYDAAFASKLSEILQAEPSRPDWVLIDYAPYWAPALAAKHGVPCAFLSLFGGAALGFMGSPETLMGQGKHARTRPEHLTAVPAYVPFPTTVAFRGYEAREIFNPGLVPDDYGVSESYRFSKSIAESRLVGVRSSDKFEPEWLRLVGELYKKPVIPLGLFPPSPTQDVAGHEATLQWLDKQAPGSVVYAAFGSEVKLKRAQLHTIALGLEASGLPFLWAFRAPADADARNGEGAEELPEGYEQRVNGRGLVCRGWVPQARLLAHESMGGFLTHAGWNSITEGLARGVRLVLLPLMFEQGLNARHLVEKKVAVEVDRDEEDGSFTADGIAVALRRVMVDDSGEGFGTKAKELAKVFGNEEENDQLLRDFLRIDPYTAAVTSLLLVALSPPTTAPPTSNPASLAAPCPPPSDEP
ncbi:hypothetical protein PR202_gb04105 [Eleusine coracana subsp. coracana]|uniref:Glycosyltransferase n=1 Tax=Eleusine coracana subsp. coracana TaxID=191504 RepID=A0AAV5E3M4_ELECO|nr:hypothetical protein PR202_gb04105 [Eleusine coracana subsp. coracana]